MNGNIAFAVSRHYTGVDKFSQTGANCARAALWTALNVATRNLDALRIDPAIVLREQRCDHPTDVVGNTCSAQRCPCGHSFVHGRIVADNPAAEIRFRGTRSDNVDGNPSRSEFLRHIFRQHFNRPLYRAIRRASRRDEARSRRRYVDNPSTVLDERKWHGKFPGGRLRSVFTSRLGLRHEVFRVRFGASSTIATLATTMIPNALLKPNSCAVNPISGGPARKPK
jgi:hypothetical protein